MAPMSSKCTKKEANRGAWTSEEDRKLAQVIEIHGPKKWKSVAAKAGSMTKELKLEMEMGAMENQNREGTSNADDQEDSSKSTLVGNHEFFNCYIEEPLDLDWMGRLFEMDDSWFNFA
ncbi:hypothetical protein JRO89_XS03G0297600 [Xanthoceras sorbifolium]|uniref:Uncharacterized protein n=1 Tax=Xanthoceras sorbifolium TaxID=99658 RepID=A0ABQ8ICX9_9ROSI|nr:hypothetical protein JRO89_XS03G0297600 [Xanthoceras sorbifolium]